MTMYNLTNFTIKDMTYMGRALRNLGTNVHCLEDVANEVVGHLYEQLVDGDQKRVLALIRFYKTHAYANLPEDLRHFADGLAGGPERLAPLTKCLTLLASAGEKPNWNTRQNSSGHKAIPLSSEEAVLKLPMVTQLVQQFGLEISEFVRPASEMMVDASQTNFNVFFVPEAVGSPYVPAQSEFVIPCDIKSVVSFGGMLLSGNIFAVIMFLKIAVKAEIADMFQNMALSVKLATLSFDENEVFSPVTSVEG